MGENGDTGYLNSLPCHGAHEGLNPVDLGNSWEFRSSLLTTSLEG